MALRAQDDYSCPLGAVDGRLADAHHLWHRAEASYFDPDEFRVNLHSLIQAIRSVTFVLQSQKHQIPDFENWYAPHQAMLRESDLMRWLVIARNQIEKQGDLATLSIVRAQIIASHLDEFPMMEIHASLFESPMSLFERVPKLALEKQVINHGLLRIERRWVAQRCGNVRKR